MQIRADTSRSSASVSTYLTIIGQVARPSSVARHRCADITPSSALLACSCKTRFHGVAAVWQDHAAHVMCSPAPKHMFIIHLRLSRADLLRPLPRPGATQLCFVASTLKSLRPAVMANTCGSSRRKHDVTRAEPPLSYMICICKPHQSPCRSRSRALTQAAPTLAMQHARTVVTRIECNGPLNNTHHVCNNAAWCQNCTLTTAKSKRPEHADKQP